MLQFVERYFSSREKNMLARTMDNFKKEGHSLTTVRMLVLFSFACILKEYLNPKWCQTISNSPQKFGTLIYF